MTVVTALLQASSLLSSLSQHRTNGKYSRLPLQIICVLLASKEVLCLQYSRQGGSNLGTLAAPKLPKFLENNPIINGFPWGSKRASTSDPYTGSPDTGVIRSYDFTIARGTVSPDGYSKSMLLINGQYPGPLIEANWGDTIQVTVNNAIYGPAEGTAMHWHGLNQQNSEWADGVPGISMCPVPPGGSFTHTFKATPYGSTFYHSHYSSQYADGLWGPLVIHGPMNYPYDIDLGPVTINDYYHKGYLTILEGVVGTDLSDENLVRPPSDNNLINGKMNFACGNSTGNSTTGTCVNNAGLSKFGFTSGKKHRLRLINSGIAAIQKFSIDNHKMTVIANDFIPIVPYETTIVTLGVSIPLSIPISTSRMNAYSVQVGQRTDVVVEATGNPTDIVWMRSTITSGACTEPANQPYALAVIYYEDANTNSAPGNASVAQIDTTPPCLNDPLSDTVPMYPIAAAGTNTTITMNVAVAVNSTGHIVWTINDSAFRADWNNPILLLAKSGNISYPAVDSDWNVYNTGTNATVRVVVNNLSPTSHPWHLHGHEMQVLSVGYGKWGGAITNPSNPERRDVQIVPASGYAVFQWQQDNPGVWPFHCHIAWHVSGGLYANIMERPADIKNVLIPSTAYQNCRNWADYSGGNLLPQIDSVQATCRSLIVDTLPESQQQIGSAWAGRMLGLGHVLGYLVSTVDLSKYVGTSLGATQFKQICVIAGAVILFCVSVTCFCVEERVLLSNRGIGNIVEDTQNDPPSAEENQSCLLDHILVLVWYDGLLSLVLYGTTWVGETYYRQNADNAAELQTTEDIVGEIARKGSLALVLFSMISFTSSIILPFLVSLPSDDTTRYPVRNNPPPLKRSARLLQRYRVDIATAWGISQLVFAASMILAPFSTSFQFATTLIALCGASWAMYGWAPLAILGEEINKLSPSTSIHAARSEDVNVEMSLLSDDPLFMTDEALSPIATPQASNLDAVEAMAGIYLGIHNIFATIPQFLATFVSMIVFSILEPGQSPELATGDVPSSAADGAQRASRQLAKSSLSGTAVCLAIGAVFQMVAAAQSFRMRWS
ncbi:MAG: hypothetical protein ASARMPRED_008719 [Alectoria sarmentosa]|nr:MAG: hypothetical protein ASARMPRED_008719 [Alectoria sarmentosa]